MKDKLDSIKISLANLDKIVQRVKADDSIDRNVSDTVDLIYNVQKDLYSAVNWVADMLFNFIDKHSQGHLPPITSAEKMQNALEVLGIDEDYEIRKPVIYASASRKGHHFEINLDSSTLKG